MLCFFNFLNKIKQFSLPWCRLFHFLSPSFPTGLPFIPGAAATRGGLSLFEPQDCEDGRGGSRTVNRSSSWRLDAKMEPFVHELVYSGERECFFFLVFVFVFCFFLRCPEYLWLSKKHFTRSAAGSRASVQDGGLEKFPAVCRFVPHTVQRFPTPV